MSIEREILDHILLTKEKQKILLAHFDRLYREWYELQKLVDDKTAPTKGDYYCILAVCVGVSAYVVGIFFSLLAVVITSFTVFIIWATIAMRVVKKYNSPQNRVDLATAKLELERVQMKIDKNIAAREKLDEELVDFARKELEG